MFKYLTIKNIVLVLKCCAKMSTYLLINICIILFAVLSLQYILYKYFKFNLIKTILKKLKIYNIIYK